MFDSCSFFYVLFYLISSQFWGYGMWLKVKKWFGASRLMYKGVGWPPGQPATWYYGYCFRTMRTYKRKTNRGSTSKDVIEKWCGWNILYGVHWILSLQYFWRRMGSVHCVQVASIHKICKREHIVLWMQKLHLRFRRLIG